MSTDNNSTLPQRPSKPQPPQRLTAQPPRRATAQPPQRATAQPPQRATAQQPKHTASQSPKLAVSQPTQQRATSQKQKSIVNENIDFASLADKYLGLVLGCLGLILAFFLSWLPEGLVSLAVASGGVYYSHKGHKKEATSYVHIIGLFISITAITIIVLSMTSIGLLYRQGNLCDAISQLGQANNVFNRIYHF